MSVPNQKTIIIHQSKEIPFLKIGVKELLAAYKTIKTPSSFVLFLYLASNKDGYKLELSKEAFHEATGYSKSSYHRAVDHLTKLGYIFQDGGGRFNFVTIPKGKQRGLIQDWDCGDARMNQPSGKDELTESQKCNAIHSGMNTEIDNRKNRKEQIKTDAALFKDYSYLDKLISYEDGSYLWEGEHRYLDGSTDFLFWTRPKDEIIKAIVMNNPFDYDEARYIVQKMFEHEEK